MNNRIAVIGAGPAGSAAAICLRKLGHDVEIFESQEFPRYRLGESLLPGTLSILKRLGVYDKIESKGFVKKPSATFLWGRENPPYTFAFEAHSDDENVFGHAIQVLREEFDDLLACEAGNMGAKLNFGVAVRDFEQLADNSIRLVLADGKTEEEKEYDYVIDASGSSSIFASKLDVRRYDEFYKSLAVWSYYQLDDKFKDDLQGTTYSITHTNGWIWMIPLRDGTYSIGCIVDQENLEKIKEIGKEAFYLETIASCEAIAPLIEGGKHLGPARMVRDWSFDSEHFSNGNIFLSGDSVCFTDPLFSQGVHLAVRGGVSAACAVGALIKGENKDIVSGWYEKSYRDAYEQYHEFVA